MTQFTDAQIRAITFNEEKNVLISANAGAGKSTVLTERIIQKVKNGTLLSELFVSTFTVKASAELKNKIEKAIKEELLLTKNHILQQRFTLALQELPFANIGTMDAFANKVVKQYYLFVNVDPNFRVLTDKSEQDILKNEVFDTLVESALRNQIEELPVEDFKELIKNFSKGRNFVDFKEIICNIYNFCQSAENPTQWLRKNFMIGFDTYQSFSDLPVNFTDTVKEDLQLFYDELSIAYNNHLLGKGSYKNKAENALNEKKQILNASTLAEFIDMFYSIDFNIQAQIKRDGKTKEILDDDLVVEQKKYYTEIKNETVGAKGTVANFCNQFKNYRMIESEYKNIRKIAESLQKFSLIFASTYLARKRSENAFEFSDISHFAIEILEKHSEIVQNYHFKEILIDEYQDTNRQQERLLELLSAGKQNLYMVGDIKQSIYGFRQADPTLFSQKYNHRHKTPNEVLQLTDNFRSRPQILNFINEVFGRLMDDKIGVTYNESEKLTLPATYDENAIDKSGKKIWELPVGIDARPELLLYVPETLDIEKDDSDILSNEEIDLASKKIIELINAGVSPEKITILVRSSTNNNKIEDVLNSHGIPVVLDEGRADYLKSIEVQVILDALRAINNPFYDLSLVSLLRSPLFGFNEEDLARISLQGGPDKSFWEKVEQAIGDNRTNLIDNKLYSKLTGFTVKFTEWREFSTTAAIHELLWKMYVDSGYYQYVTRLLNGEQRQANLQALMTRAERYEKNGYRGLVKFIDLIDTVLMDQNDLTSVTVKLPQKAVRVMTIHKSKGLQFDYVFIMNFQKKFNTNDFTKSPIILNRDKGIGFKVMGHLNSKIFPKASIKFDSFPYIVNQKIAENQMLSEEMRLLYVAFTRAVKKLYMVGKLPNDRKIDTYNSAEVDNILADKYRKRTSEGFLGWLLALNQGNHHQLKTLKFDGITTSIMIPKIQLNQQQQENDNPSENQPIKSFDMTKYDRREAVILPSMQTPSLMKKRYERLLDEESIEPNPKFELLSFDEKKVSATDIGSAIHSFMQNIDFKNLRLQETLETLNLPNKLKKMIDIPKIRSFFDTPFGQLLRNNADKVSKEVPFSMLKTDEASGEQFVVRGIVDGYLKLDDKMILFDYKTDHFKNPLELITRYQMQMTLYAEALNKAYSKPVEKYLILLGGKSKVEVISL